MQREIGRRRPRSRPAQRADAHLMMEDLVRMVRHCQDLAVTSANRTINIGEQLRELRLRHHDLVLRVERLEAKVAGGN
jgi:hypothetical protein